MTAFAAPCRCGHTLLAHHIDGDGPCNVCRCPEYRADRATYPLGQGVITS